MDHVTKLELEKASCLSWDMSNLPTVRKPGKTESSRQIYVTLPFRPLTHPTNQALAKSPCNELISNPNYLQYVHELIKFKYHT